MIIEYLKKRLEDTENADFIVDWSIKDQYEEHMPFRYGVVLIGRTDELDIIDLEEPTIQRY